MHEMQEMEKGKMRNLSIASVAALATTMAASAGFMPATPSFTVSSTAGSATVTNNATQLASGVFAHTGSWVVTGASITWSNNVFGWNDSTSNGFLNSNIVIKNETGATQTFVFYMSMSGTAPGLSSLTGSVGGQFVNGSSGLGMLSSVGPLWAPYVDSTLVGSVLPDSLFFAPPYSVASLGSHPITSTYSGSVGSGIGVRYSVTLSSGIEASFNSSVGFQVVPAPGALALLGFVPLAGSRRRRH